MPADQYLARLSCRQEFNNSPLSATVTLYVEALLAQRYAKSTIRLYLHALAHFGHWMKAETLCLESIDAALTERFIREHLPACTCSMSLHSGVADTRAALRYLLKLLAQERPVKSSEDDPITTELGRFDEYLQNICGVAPQTNARRCKDVGAFLTHCFGAEPLVLSPLSGAQIDAFLATLIPRLRPASLRVVCNNLRSYFRFRALLGESTDALSAALPRVADWRHATLPKALSDAQLEAFLKAFDCSNPVELRDYAIARCLLDLGLRGDEVAHLTLKSVDWRNGTLTLDTNKSKRVQQLPLPVPTGEAIARYLRYGRPQTTDRNLFVRHRAPADTPLSVAAIRNAMNRAFVRCGLRDQFCNTHVLRRTTATRLQRAGASVKEIADLLRHQSIDTASAYARVDLEGLRAAALPWPGSRS
ncbi:Tyrosine recombinase XerC [Pseudomonas fluorescens]|uniref:tyrosine-type recombinase/integrase n=1 Tax=Pseudomonas fluorescens TaxID=294 RepID=UPI000FA83C55|nr:tyrosine-type recombinase/integrase [Pseudomonas fluorescens]VVM60604.1 Tyrosine recombinase XerC [Pseudomonas fluorescens]VVN90742.1 Tyrosine recombinase XerC [Pseudomonas fluorescens]VVO56342.1 Tyrosine recombinase XerC [Pseudomonas fluorescens]